MSERDDFEDDVAVVQQCGGCGERQAVRNPHDPCQKCGEAKWKPAEMIFG